MTVTARRYTSEPGFTDDFFAVREFLVRINADRVTTPGFLGFAPHETGTWWV